jgi:hypothetical protein
MSTFCFRRHLRLIFDLLAVSIPSSQDILTIYLLYLLIDYSGCISQYYEVTFVFIRLVCLGKPTSAPSRTMIFGTLSFSRARPVPIQYLAEEVILKTERTSSKRPLRLIPQVKLPPVYYLRVMPYRALPHFRIPWSSYCASIR